MSVAISAQEVIAPLERDDTLYALAEIDTAKVPSKRRSRIRVAPSTKTLHLSSVASPMLANEGVPYVIVMT